MTEFHLRSFAKINLGLKIVEARDDGYHSINTVFQEVDLSDILSFRRTTSNSIEFHCDNPDIDEDEGNLCVQAYQFLAERFRCVGGLDLHLQKRIPVAAGLGGGSSNAATTLLGVAMLYGLPAHVFDMNAIAFQIGADVPFFLFGGIARGKGIGEQIVPMRKRIHKPVVIVLPELEISTSWAYKRINKSLTRSGKKNILLGFFEKWVDYKRVVNDFESVIINEYSEIGEIKERLLHLHADVASLSGSGSAVFGIFPEWDSAERAYTSLASRYRCELVRPIYRTEKRLSSFLS